jgi:hypothetical protein
VVVQRSMFGVGRFLTLTLSAAKPTAAYDSKWATSFITGDVFTKLVYTGA